MVIHLTEQGVSRTLFAAAVLLFAAAQGMLWHSGLRFNGDEPHILLTSLSIIKHFDLNMYPSFREHDFTALGFSNLDWQVPPVNGFIPPEKGIGFPVLITPLYAAFGLAGTRLALIGLNAAVTFVLLFYNCTKIGLSVPCAGLACLALAALLPWEVHAGLIIPEALAGAMTMAILAFYLRFQRTGHWLDAFGIGLLTTLLPIIYLKYAPLAVGSLVLLLANRALLTNPATYAAAPLLIAYGVVWVSIYGYKISVGTGASPDDFNVEGFSRQIWYAFIDRDHGLWVWAPLTVLPVAGLIWWRRRNCDVQAYLVTTFCLYAALYGLTTLKPGYSAPGRYLSAAIPIAVMLSALALMRSGNLYRTRIAVFCGFILASGAILFGSIAMGKHHLPPFYANMFPQLYYPG